MIWRVWRDGVFFSAFRDSERARRFINSWEGPYPSYMG